MSSEQKMLWPCSDIGYCDGARRAISKRNTLPLLLPCRGIGLAITVISKQPELRTEHLDDRFTYFMYPQKYRLPNTLCAFYISPHCEPHLGIGIPQWSKGETCPFGCSKPQKSVALSYRPGVAWSEIAKLSPKTLKPPAQNSTETHSIPWHGNLGPVWLSCKVFLCMSSALNDHTIWMDDILHHCEWTSVTVFEVFTAPIETRLRCVRILCDGWLR